MLSPGRNMRRTLKRMMRAMERRMVKGTGVKKRTRRTRRTSYLHKTERKLRKSGRP